MNRPALMNILVQNKKKHEIDKCYLVFVAELIYPPDLFNCLRGRYGFFFTLAVDECQPLGIRWSGTFSHDDLEEFCLEFLGDLAAFARADGDAVDRTDRRD